MKEIEWNIVKYIDCLDEKEGLPSLPDKSIDLGFTDPPWLVDYSKSKKQNRKYVNGRILKFKEHNVHYEDTYNQEWNFLWFNELIRICKGLIIVMGQKPFLWWVKNTNPRGTLIIYFKNGTGQSKISQWNRFRPYLFYGDYFREHKIFANVIEYVIPWGFLSNEKWIHPSPKGTEIALKILKDLKPKSLIDPFAGSGSYLKAADILGIKWLGYEINPIYKQDIDKRFEQQTIEAFF